MNEKKKQEKVVDISTAKNFGRRTSQALSTMSTLSKVTKRGVSRTPEQGKGRFHSGRNEHSLFMSHVSRMGDHPSIRGRRRRVVEAQLVAKICQDIEVLKDQFGDSISVRDALEVLQSLLIEEYV